MSDPTPPPSSSLVAGKYQLNGLIGRGGMGSVWEGRHVTLGTRVAVKFIEKEYAESQEARQRFYNEARAAATIQSKYAVQIFDHGVTDDGRPFIVMELLEGEGLDRRIERLGRIPLNEVARTMMHVCRALQRAHDGGIIHRDLKPENIFLQRANDDDEDTAKVLDFGIAKVRNVDGNTLSNSTKTGAVLGTPYFMSPEQARGLRELDYRTDLWSLGVIAFKAATGVLPFDGQSLGDLLVKICTAPMPVPSQVLPDLPPAFDAWFARALDRDPAARFQSATELADALAFAAGLSVKRGPGSIPNPVPPRASPAPAVSGSSTVSSPAFNATSAPLTATSPGTSKRGAGAAIGIGVVTLLLGGAGAFAWNMSRTRATIVPSGSAIAPTASTSAAIAAAAPADSTAHPGPTLVIEPLPTPPPVAVSSKPATTKPASKNNNKPPPIPATRTDHPAADPPKVEKPAPPPVPTKPKSGDPGF